MGTDVVMMTPSRGYGVELAGVVIIALASTYGLPVSTTQTIVSPGALLTTSRKMMGAKDLSRWK